MEYLKFPVIFPLLAALLSSCSDNEAGDGGTSGNPVTFVAEASGYTTRLSVAGDAWSKGDRIGVYMLDGSGAPVYDKAVNVPYACAEDGASVPFTADSPLYMPDGKSVSFVAYYPYGGVVSGHKYRVLLADQARGTDALDVMYSRADGQSAATGVPLAFAHQLAKVSFKLVDKDKNPIEADGEVTIAGMDAAADFDLLTGKVEADKNIESGIAVCHRTDDKSYEAIVLPSDVTSAYKLSGSIAGKAFEWSFLNTDINLPTLQKGTRYTFTIPFENGVPGTGRVEQVGSGMGAAPWNAGDETTGMGSAINYELFPETSTSGAFTDTELKLTFRDGAPGLGTQGYIRIRRADNGTIVDEINMAEREEPMVEGKTRLNSWMDIIGVTPKGADRNRKLVVNYHAVQVQGNTIVIKPHSQRLQFGTTYYVTIDREAIRQTGFKGIAGRSWLFATRKKPVVDGNKLTVSHSNPNADFYTLQGAIDYFAAHMDRDASKEIYMENGTYQEIVNLRDQRNLTISGQDREKTVLRYDNKNSMNGGINEGIDIEQSAPLGMLLPRNPGNRSVLTIAGNADKVKFQNMTFENTTGNNGQAEAVIVRTGGTCATKFLNCNFHGYQDTVIGGGGYNLFYGCLVTGATDFIWGGPVVSLFENCEIRAVADGRALNARVNSANPGYVYSGCRFTAADNVSSMALIEPSTGDNLTFVNTVFADAYIRPGLKKPTPETPSLSEGVKMYNCTDSRGRQVSDVIEGRQYIYKLSEDEYKSRFATRQVILKGYSDAAWFNE